MSVTPLAKNVLISNMLRFKVNEKFALFGAHLAIFCPGGGSTAMQPRCVDCRFLPSHLLELVAKYFRSPQCYRQSAARIAWISDTNIASGLMKYNMAYK
jgi:hypothetical protein